MDFGNYACRKPYKSIRFPDKEHPNVMTISLFISRKSVKLEFFLLLKFCVSQQTKCKQKPAKKSIIRKTKMEVMRFSCIIALKFEKLQKLKNE